MKKSMFRRVVCGFLTVLMLLGTLSTAVFAAEEKTDGEPTPEEEKNDTVTSLEEIRELLNMDSYVVYLEQNKDKKPGKDTFKVDLVKAYEEDEESKEAGIKIGEYGTDGDKRKGIYLPEEGTADFKIEVKNSGLYTFDMSYYPIEAKATSIQRMLYIDGKVPFSEARYLEYPKIWADKLVEVDKNGEDVFYTEKDGKALGFKRDNTQNDIRPTKEQTPMWSNYTFSDSTGFMIDPLTVYLEKGEHIISFEAVREPVVFSEMTFRPAEKLQTYEEYLKNGYKKVDSSVEPVRIEAEYPTYTSDQTVYPLNDRSSPISYPQNASKIRLNTIGGEKWENAGQWIKYNVNVKKSGLYEIVLRYKQSTLEGMYSTRRLYINGEIPFEEANYLEFAFSNDWQISPIGRDGEHYLFYLEEGTNELMFEVGLGSMSEVLNQVDDCLTKMNNAYLKILMITGSSPDADRDYNFSRLVPDAIYSLGEARDGLKEVSAKLEEITGEKGSHTATLDKIVVLLDRMVGKDLELEIAKNLTNLKSYIGTLGTWLLDSRAQPLEIDYILVQPEGTSLPEANAGFFDALSFEFQSFFLSFFTDYSTLGATGDIDLEKSVSVWTTTGREKSNIMRQIIDAEFTPEYGIGVELKLVSGGVLQSTLAGIGPDVAFLASADCVNYAIRDAVLPLNDMEGFEESMKRFNSASTIPLTLYGTTYGLPDTTTFLMMFYRMDILAELGIEVPRTWDELKQIIPTLQNNNMTIGFPSKLAGVKLFLYQMGGEMYADDGKRINLSSNKALAAFTELTDLFQSYRFPLTYDFANRFRTGEMPIGIVDYITYYNQLTVFAPEIDGLWEFTSLPGFEDENGNINNCSVVTVQGICLMRGARDNKEEAWKFIDWYTSAQAQADYSNELVAVVGQSSKNSTANLEALEMLPWTAREYRNLKSQFDNTVGITEYPGGYILARYVDFAFMNVYNNGASAVESMLDYVTEINKEITRKRKEFDFDYYEISYSDSSQFIESVE